jgi:hypothetical protein
VLVCTFSTGLGVEGNEWLFDGADKLLQRQVQPRCPEEEDHLTAGGEVVRRIWIREFFSNLLLFLSSATNCSLKSVLKIEGIILQTIQRVEAGRDRAGACRAGRTGRRLARSGGCERVSETSPGVRGWGATRLGGSGRTERGRCVAALDGMY